MEEIRAIRGPSIPIKFKRPDRQQTGVNQSNTVDETISADHTKGKEAAIWQPHAARSEVQLDPPPPLPPPRSLQELHDNQPTLTPEQFQAMQTNQPVRESPLRGSTASYDPGEPYGVPLPPRSPHPVVPPAVMRRPKPVSVPPRPYFAGTHSLPRSWNFIADSSKDKFPEDSVSVPQSADLLNRKRTAKTPPTVNSKKFVPAGYYDERYDWNNLRPFHDHSRESSLPSDHIIDAPSNQSHHDHIKPLENEIRRLRAANSELRSRLSNERLPHRWVVVHRTSDATESAASRYYLDKPEWCKSQAGTWKLQGQDHVQDFLRFVDLQKGTNVAFIAIIDHSSSGRDMPPKGADEQPRSCSIVILCETLDNAFQDIFDLCPHLRQYKDHVSMEHYEDVDATTLQNLDTFFYYFSTQIHTACQAIKSQDLRQQLDLLINFVRSVFAQGYAKADSHFSEGIVSRETVRYLFEPTTLLVHSEKGVMKGLRQISFMSENAHARCWNIKTEHWICQDRIRKTLGSFDIPFKEVSWQPSKIDNLSLFPLKYADEQRQNLLRRRGETIWACRRPTYVLYDGLNMSKDTSHSNARFMIDMKTYQKLHPATPSAEPSDLLLGREQFDLDTEAGANISPPDDGFVYMTQQNIYGFNMAEKNWEDLNLDNIIPNQWDKSSFHTLAIDHQSKELITALVTNKIATDQSTDYIANKGTGLILLLHGGPGTGKTLTAESVAEFAEKPLYRVTCGDIGTEPRHVESYLEKVFYLGKIWGCVVLLDEADVFLEQRTLTNLERNALVSVFLRTLEYYDGILILTSNRVGTFDEAFKSRIQLALHYQNLDYGQRKQIWENFITRLQSLEELIDIDAILPNCGKLAAKHEINGRQIRNAITTARQLALYKKEPLNMAHLEHSIAVSGSLTSICLMCTKFGMMRWRERMVSDRLRLPKSN